jgi:erythromycin esterase
MIRSLENEIELAKKIKEAIKGSKVVDKGRDSRMAANLKWLIENKFKNQKIIVWAADVHVARAIDISKFYPQMNETMGSKFIESVENPKDVYTIGFTSYQCEAGRVGSPGYSIKYKTRNSFETWFTDKQPFAFIDFKKFNSLYPTYNEKFYAMPITHIMGLEQWNRAFDGLFFIRNMFRCIPTRSMKILSFFGPDKN